MILCRRAMYSQRIGFSIKKLSHATLNDLERWFCRQRHYDDVVSALSR